MKSIFGGKFLVWLFFPRQSVKLTPEKILLCRILHIQLCNDCSLNTWYGVKDVQILYLRKVLPDKLWSFILFQSNLRNLMKGSSDFDQLLEIVCIHFWQEYLQKLGSFLFIVRIGQKFSWDQFLIIFFSIDFCLRIYWVKIKDKSIEVINWLINGFE